MAAPLRIAFIGAGAANFGGGEGPWDHASRLERIEGLECVGVADPDTVTARKKLAERRHSMFAGTRVYPDFHALIAGRKPDAVWIGVPPNVHGTDEPGRDLELRCAAAGIHMFIEKPLTSARPEKNAPVAAAMSAAGIVTAVGYMFRHSRPVGRLREILAETPGGARAFLGRYDCAYSEIRKREWWDVRASGGPIVEQATHFVDLARHLCGEVRLDTVRGVCLPGNDPAAELTDAPKDGHGRPLGQGVPPEFRHPWVTAAVWRFAGGGIGSLTHAALLHGRRYETEIEIWGDGLRLVLEDPYGRPRLSLRRPRGEVTEIETFDDDDPYLNEDIEFVNAVRAGDPSAVRCPYADAAATHALAWAITDAARG